MFRVLVHIWTLIPGGGSLQEGLCAEVSSHQELAQSSMDVGAMGGTLHLVHPGPQFVVQRQAHANGATW